VIDKTDPKPDLCSLEVSKPVGCWTVKSDPWSNVSAKVTKVVQNDDGSTTVYLEISSADTPCPCRDASEDAT
jgi:hypothetical protein